MPESVVKIKIMISSTRADLSQYREEASQIIRMVAAEKEKKVQLVEVSMEKETQSGDREFAVAVSKRWVEEADWVVLIVGWNYGTISDEEGAGGLSVTEWEDRHAILRQKKLFVFIAGNPGTANQFRVSSEEREDLKDWIQKQTEDQKKRLEKFKDELGERHADMFANLRMFRERLEKTLKEAIDDLFPVIHAGTPFAELIVALTPDIRDCIRKVTLIANCKRIHDYLHELCQHVIRPLREEVLSQWMQEGTLSMSRERAIWGRVYCASRQIGAISDASRSIDPKHRELLDSLDNLLKLPPLWNVESDSPHSRLSVEAFAELLDSFAEAVQDAFSEADRSMTAEESDLRERYLALREGLKQARQQWKLDPADNKRLDEELVKVRASRKRVQNSLSIHHRWQEAHDKLHELDAFRETTLFGKRLNHYRESWLSTKLLPLVGMEIQKAETHQAGSAETDQGDCFAVVQPVSREFSQGFSPACDPFFDNLLRLKERLERLRAEGGVAAFDEMRKPFDDTFYCVDKRTLKEVSSAGERACDLEKWLDDLTTRQREAD